VSESTTENQMDGTIESAISSLIAPEEIIEDTIEEETQETEEISAESEVEEIDSEEDVTEDEEVQASDSDEDYEDQVEDARSEEPRYSVKVDGAEVEVSLEDLKQGYSGQQYVQKGMQEASAQKKEAEAVYTALTNERQQIAELYQSLQQGGFAPQPVKPTKDLFDADPIGYMQKNLAYEEEMGTWNNQMAQLEQVSQKQSQAQNNAKQAYLQEQMQILAREIPEFADTAKASKLKEQLVKVGSNTYGYTNEEIGQITDARAIKVLNDAMKYQDIISGKSKAKVKTASAKSVIKPGAKRMATPNAKIRQRQQAKLKGSGDMKDALDLILNT
jgi:hypothetical protein